MGKVRTIILPFFSTTNEYMKATVSHLYPISGSAYVHGTNEIVRKRKDREVLHRIKRSTAGKKAIQSYTASTMAAMVRRKLPTIIDTVSTPKKGAPYSKTEVVNIISPYPKSSPIRRQLIKNMIQDNTVKGGESSIHHLLA